MKRSDLVSVLSASGCRPLRNNGGHAEGVVAVKEYTATATREDSQWWVVDVDGVGTTQGRTTAEAQRMAVDLVSALEEVPAEKVRVDVTFKLGNELDAVVYQARADTHAAERAQRRAAEQSRRAVRRILDSGFSKQDAARILKVAPQRISQLTK